MDNKTQKKKDIALFLLKLNLLLIPFYSIIYFDVSVYSIQSIFANLIVHILKIFNIDARTSEYFIFLPDKPPIDISWDCVGWKSTYSLFALVFASRGRLNKKLRFISVWIPVLLLINIFRVVGIIIIGFYFGVSVLNLIHTFMWQPMMIVIVVGIWYIWLRSNFNKKEKHN